MKWYSYLGKKLSVPSCKNPQWSPFKSAESIIPRDQKIITLNLRKASKRHLTSSVYNLEEDWSFGRIHHNKMTWKLPNFNQDTERIYKDGDIITNRVKHKGIGKKRVHMWLNYNFKKNVFLALFYIIHKRVPLIITNCIHCPAYDVLNPTRAMSNFMWESYLNSIGWSTQMRTFTLNNARSCILN
jgi:hypothetical protein